MATPDNQKQVPVFDYSTGDFKKDPQGRIVTVTGTDAVAEIVQKAQMTARGLYLIYAKPETPALNHKYGSDVQDILTRRELTEATRISELTRAVREALIYDPWIQDVRDVVVQRFGSDSAEASFTVVSVFGTVNVQGVSLTNG